MGLLNVWPSICVCGRAYPYYLALALFYKILAWAWSEFWTRVKLHGLVLIPRAVPGLMIGSRYQNVVSGFQRHRVDEVHVLGSASHFKLFPPDLASDWSERRQGGKVYQLIDQVQESCFCDLSIRFIFKVNCYSQLCYRLQLLIFSLVRKGENSDCPFFL